MITAVLRHLLESTAFAILMLLVVAFLRHSSASIRHSLLLSAALKFALPLHWLLAFGARLRSIVPESNMQMPGPLNFHRIMPASAAGIPEQTGTLLSIAFLSVWFAVALLILFGWARKLGACVDISDTVPSTALTALERMKARMGIAREVNLRTSAGNVEPRLCGFLSSTIVLPEKLPQHLEPAELEAIVLHELAHVRRWDNLTRALVHALTCVFWFFPLLLWLERCIDLECELACDELVLMCGAQPREYLDGIFKVCQSYLLEPIPGSSSVSGSNLKRRTEFIMTFRMGKTKSPSARVLVGTLASGLAFAAIIAGFLTTTSNHVRVLAASTSVETAVSCKFGGNYSAGTGVKYPEGTVIQVGNGPEQMCVKLRGGNPLWVQISDKARTRSQHIVSLSEPAPFVCNPSARDGDYCTCNGRGRFSLNATAIGPDHQVLSCGAHGKWMQPYSSSKH